MFKVGQNVWIPRTDGGETLATISFISHGSYGECEQLSVYWTEDNTSRIAYGMHCRKRVSADEVRRSL
jgi:hypothetical protein